MNTASASGASVGVGFAVPADSEARVVPALVAEGVYCCPWLGAVRAAKPVLPATSGAIAALPLSTMMKHSTANRRSSSVDA